MGLTQLKFDPNRKKVKYCPCGKSNKDGKFSPYIGWNNKGYCHSCAKTFLPGMPKNNLSSIQYYRKPKKDTIGAIQPELLDELISSTRGASYNDFILGLQNQFRFSDTHIEQVIKDYLIVNLSTWNGAVGFVYLDINRNFRQLKSMAFDPETCKRIKTPEPRIRYIGKKLISDKDIRLASCFFGEHLLTKYLDKPIAIVESEKTAIICSVYYSQFVWLATGGKNGCKWKDKEIAKPIANIARKVYLFPDLNAIEQWQVDKYDIQENIGSTQIEVIDLNKIFDTKISSEAISKGYDLADFLANIPIESFLSYGV